MRQYARGRSITLTLKAQNKTNAKQTDEDERCAILHMYGGKKCRSHHESESRLEDSAEDEFFAHACAQSEDQCRDRTVRARGRILDHLLILFDFAGLKVTKNLIGDPVH